MASARGISKTRCPVGASAIYEEEYAGRVDNPSYEDAQRFIEKWPVGKQAVNPQNIQEYFKLLGLHV